jgi:hypothetical protein
MSVSGSGGVEPCRWRGKADRKLTATQLRAHGERRTNGARQRRRFQARESGASARKEDKDSNNVLFLTGSSKQSE